MRLFLICWDGGQPEFNDVARELKKNGHDILYWTTNSADQELKSKFPNTIFHDHFKAYGGFPAEGIDISKFDPPDAKLLNQLSETESIALTMMNKRYDWMSISERKHMYYDMIKYWMGVIKKMKPEVFIFPSPPHTVYDFIIYELAKFLDIATVIFYQILVSDRILTMNNFKIGSPAFLLELENNKSKNFSLSDLSNDLREIFERQTNSSVDNTPQYFKKGMAGYSLKNLVRVKAKIIWASVKDMTIFTKAILFIIKKFKPNLKDEYLSVMSEVDFDKRFIYFPLHYQPECSTSTLGGVYADQILMIETAAAALPEGWVIYVKEHPGQWLPRGFNFFGCRYDGYYKTIAKIKHVSIIPVETSTFELINKCQAVATITGTVGWEGILRSKPVIIFGFPWYQCGPGVFKINSAESCRKAFESIMGGGALIEKQDIINFLYSLDKATLKGYFSDYAKSLSKLSKEENKNNVLAALIKELEKIKINYEKQK